MQFYTELGLIWDLLVINMGENTNCEWKKEESIRE